MIHFAHNAKQRGTNTWKYKVRNVIRRILHKWQCRKYENDARELQKEADDNDYKPIWNYRRIARQKQKWANVI